MNIVLGVSGGIAAYKIPELVRRLNQQDCKVKVVLTRVAEDFVAYGALSALTQAYRYNEIGDADNMLHISLARWADYVVIAPASANFIAGLAHGFADDLLSTLCVATTAPIGIAPAMNREMWLNTATQTNIKSLRSRNIDIIGPADGQQACGEIGPGRMLEPKQLCQFLLNKQRKPILAGKHILITAGPTHEAIDNIRYLSNRSSGQMGYALAEAAVNLGATVTLISGPVNLVAPLGVRLVSVTSAGDMYQAVMTHIKNQDIFISAAAVADYTLAQPETTKIKKQAGDLQLSLQRTQDILLEVSQLEGRPFCVGFCAEDKDLIEAATVKLKKKNLDLIIANHISDSFAKNTNKVVVIDRQLKQITLGSANKSELAYQLYAVIVNHVLPSLELSE
ncbi:MAG: bifunctional phosphopantothenoylcysteine decarboxylase/phosphopantothenate--cysteine ligase CoaBC [Gammaproteobacteria bacterium]|nr:bifunctional phosphopantothenoylcysteine decarboxylase/phosphopantothenate--cysteine ligase CoaBC [Gammaproteobacteria bacterium]